MKAILWRELKVALGSTFGMAFQFLTPVFMLIFFATIFASNINGLSYEGTSIGYLTFFVPGLFGYITFMILGSSMAFLRMDNQSGMLTIIILSKASLPGYFWGKYIINIIFVALKILLLAIIAGILSKYVPNFSISGIMLFTLVLFAGTGIWFAFGVIGATVLKREDLREAVLMIVSLPIMFSSTMYYNLDSAPTIIKSMSYINPLTYICNIFRAIYLGIYISELIYQALFLVVISIILLFISFHLLKKYKL